jgi:hypothetical protein
VLLENKINIFNPPLLRVLSSGFCLGALEGKEGIRKGLAEWFSSKFTLYRQSFDYSTPYFHIGKIPNYRNPKEG